MGIKTQKTKMLPVPLVSSPSNTPKGPPTLLWPSAWYTEWDRPDADWKAFPNIEELNSRKNGKFLASIDFINALKLAERLWIVDPHFDEDHGVKPLMEALAGSTIVKLRINGGKRVEKLKRNEYVSDFRKLLESLHKRRVIEVEWRNTLDSVKGVEVHDRFAIVGDELWHFGGTVGGSLKAVNAFSRGWDVRTTRAEAFYEEIWKQ